MKSAQSRPLGTASPLALGIAFALASSSAAFAQTHERSEPFEEHGRVSVPFVFGVDAAITNATTSTGFFSGWRPEYVFAWSREHGALGFGVGPYGEIVGSTGTAQVFLGGGATVVGYFGRVGVALSGGLDVDWLHAVPSASPVVGLFVGFRTLELGGVDLPFGLRVDLRPALGTLPLTVIVAAQLDLIIGAGVALVAAMTSGIRD